MASAQNGLADPFTLGVASGDPAADGMVLWTRLAPEPLAEDGMPNRVVPVDWEIAADEQFGQIVRRGTVDATPDAGHSVHVELDGLRPGAEYFCRFRAEGHLSPAGRTRTAPGPGLPETGSAGGPALTMCFVSCSQYEHGYFTAYRRLAEDHPDLMCWASRCSSPSWISIQARPRSNMDAWGGYAANRDRIVAGRVEAKVRNPVVLTGDVHAAWAADIKQRWNDPGSATVGSELIATSITSGGDGSETRDETAAILGANPHIRYFNNRRGYVRTRITAQQIRADFRAVPRVSSPGARAETKASFVIEDRRPGLQPA